MSLMFRFRIALRQISVEEEHVIEALEKFNENGFINYYGHQRFGNHASVPTHKIGLFLVQGKSIYLLIIISKYHMKG